jgi:hypothetical protein|nr:MAG TPA: hypothetical protein [Caudoviricetes sp.]
MIDGCYEPQKPFAGQLLLPKTKAQNSSLQSLNVGTNSKYKGIIMDLIEQIKRMNEEMDRKFPYINAGGCAKSSFTISKSLSS